MTSDLIVFLVLSLVAIASALGMVFSRNAVYSALFLVLNFVTEAGNLQVHLTSLPANYDLYVYNAAGQLLDSSTKSKKASEMVKISNAIPGYYYVCIVGVDGAWSATNPYQLRINIPGAH